MFNLFSPKRLKAEMTANSRGKAAREATRSPCEGFGETLSHVHLRQHCGFRTQILEVSASLNGVRYLISYQGSPW